MNIYLRQRVFSISDRYKFTDYNQKLLFQGKKPALSITRMYLNDAAGRELFYIKKKLFRILPRYTIFQRGKPIMNIKGKFAIRPQFEITDPRGNEYFLKGNIIAYDFELFRNNAFIGSVRKRFLSFGDAYELAISDNFDPALFCAIAMVIDNCLHNKVH
ncbi:MAG: LURP-one-related family protein [Bacillota bacterium]|jgi:uncharacterized protein YxjI|nr:LURP-one-related family protein [Bacillota bacterium]HHU43921.1 hypothetical protein [Clostridiales bacterium]